MRISGTILVLLFTCSIVLQGQIVQHTYEDNVEGKVALENLRFIMDASGQLTIEDLLLDATLVPVDPQKTQLPPTPYYLWTSLEVKNNTAHHLNEYLVTLWVVDTLWAYTLKDQQVVNLQKTGEGISLWQKELTSVKNVISLSLAPGETKTLMLRFRIRRPGTNMFLDKLFFLESVAQINESIFKTQLWQAFYFGFMTLFSLLSFYMFRLFRDRAFLYFGGLVLGFGLYFLSVSRVSDMFLLEYFPYQMYILQPLATTIIVFCMSLFLINYLDLLKHYGVYVKVAAVGIVLMESFAQFGVLALPHDLKVLIHNVMLCVWIILCFVPIAIAVWRGESKGKVLLKTVLILFITSIVHLLQIGPGSGRGGVFVHFFQIGTMIFATVLFYDLFNRIDNIRREKDRFQEMDQLKSRFFANISHEFRTPLTLIMGPLGQLKEKFPQAEDHKLMNLMQRNAERLLGLINQILDLSKLEAGKMSLDGAVVNFPAFLKGIVMSFESLAEQQGVRLHFASEVDELDLWVDPGKVEQVFNNLLSNAFKYTTVSEEVTVLLTADEKWVNILVKDTGRGIPADQLPDIFNRFFQANDTTGGTTQGTGIGLTLVKELVNLHGGTITVRSIENKRTSFRVRLPLNQHLPERQRNKTIAKVEKELPVFATKSAAAVADKIPQLAPGDRHTSTTPLVLIVEDHEDVRFYIQQNLRKTYRIIEAVNGQEGIDKAWEYLPDLIISDVMMPEKNGYELCRALKNDQRSSHIPLILLTAKAAREEKLHGLEEGADDYLLKPFDREELLLRVRNLIESRRQLRQQFTEPAEQASIDPHLSAPDQAFLQKIYTTLDEHLSNEQFSVDVLAEAVGMSRRHLNRKLSALTDLSANPFIRNYRLQKALRMLQAREDNVSEVALATGFSSTAYFVKCFREKFGQTPGSV